MKHRCINFDCYKLQLCFVDLPKSFVLSCFILGFFYKCLSLIPTPINDCVNLNVMKIHWPRVMQYCCPLSQVPPLSSSSSLSWFSLAGQAPTKATLSLPSSAWQGRKNKKKSSWLKIRTGRDHSPITVTGKTDLTWGDYLNLVPGRVVRNKTKS